MYDSHGKNPDSVLFLNLSTTAFYDNTVTLITALVRTRILGSLDRGRKWKLLHWLKY